MEKAMKKLNSTVYQKLFLQAEEAKDRNMTKLASAIFVAIGPVPEDENNNYNFNELQNDVYQGLWKLAMCVAKYHDLQSVDAEKVHTALESLSSDLIEDVERSLHVDNTAVGPLETKVPGETK
jgi:hypothetical protein